jgi:hypothetical protein
LFSDGETEKTVNVLLNGEETALVFVEETEHDVMVCALS